MKLKINGEDFQFNGDKRTSLLDVLRENLYLTGAKGVCSEGYCGSCTILVDDIPQVACLLPVGALSGKIITTIEGVGSIGDLNEVQKALEDFDVVQCGMCFPGIVMTFTSFFKENSDPTRQQIKEAMVGNICRCTGYERIIDALMSIRK